jgi:hypothetical protein
MAKFVLLVTWLVPGQPADSYQVGFTTLERCTSARAALLNDAQRLQEERATRPAPSAAQIQPSLPFGISALCVSQ